MKRREYCSIVARELRSAAFWRDVLSECLATFFLVSVQCALPLLWEERNSGDAVQTALGMGFVVTSLAGSLGDYGGAHMNPAVTIAMAVCFRITTTRALLYIIVQCGGSIAGAAFTKSVTPAEKRGGLAATYLSSTVSPWQGYLIETWITMLLVLVVLGCTNTRRKGTLFMPTLPIGLAVACAIMCAYSSTGASMNPARSLGPAVMMGLWQNHWVYWAGPVTGGLLASAFFLLLDKPGRPAKEIPGDGNKCAHGYGRDNPGFHPG